MTVKQNSALTEFHKWLTVVGIPAVIALQLDNRSKLEEMNATLNRHDVNIENTIKVNEAQDKRLDKFDDRFQDIDQANFKMTYLNKHGQ